MDTMTQLTANDLLAIRQIVQTTVQPMFDDLAQDMASGFDDVHTKIDDLALDTAAGFDEVHERIDDLSYELISTKMTVERVERIQYAEIEHADRQDDSLQQIRQALASV